MPVDDRASRAGGRCGDLSTAVKRSAPSDTLFGHMLLEIIYIAREKPAPRGFDEPRRVGQSLRPARHRGRFCCITEHTENLRHRISGGPRDLLGRPTSLRRDRPVEFAIQVRQCRNEVLDSFGYALARRAPRPRAFGYRGSARTSGLVPEPRVPAQTSCGVWAIHARGLCPACCSRFAR